MTGFVLLPHAAFRNHQFNLPAVVSPRHHVCRLCGSQRLSQEGSTHDMEVYSTINVLYCKYVVLRCMGCNVEVMEDGKEYGLLIVSRQVRQSSSRFIVFSFK